MRARLLNAPQSPWVSRPSISSNRFDGRELGEAMSYDLQQIVTAVGGLLASVAVMLVLGLGFPFLRALLF